MLIEDTTPYQWPFDAAFDPRRCALIVCGSGSTWAARCPLDASVEANINRLRNRSALAGVAVFLIRHRPPKRVARAPGIVAPSLNTRPGEINIGAVGTDGFYGSDLDAELRSFGRDQLLFAGRGFEAAVHSTLRRANDRGYECLTVADACATLDPSMRAAAVSTIEMSGGIFGAVGSTRAVLRSLTPTQTEGQT